MLYKSEINKLVAEGSKLYAAKRYDEASERYAEACESYSKKHGEDDAELLLLYGKALFQSAVSRSGVLGSGGNNEDTDVKEKEKRDSEGDDGNFQFFDDAPLAEEDEDVETQQTAEGGNSEEEVDGDGDKQDKEQEEEQEEEQSDFEIAWEILDLARSLFERKLEESKDQAEGLTSPYLKSDTEETSNQYVILTRKLSEAYDLLGEVSLEAENFPQSAIDLEKCLTLRLKLFNPNKSSLISESHYKLSLALEFCVEDPESKSKAAHQMKLAIDSVKLRNENETDESKKKDNELLIEDLSNRYEDLKQDPAKEMKEEKLEILKGILGEPSNDSESNPIANAVNEISSMIKKKSDKSAINDLTSMVKKRKSGNSSSCVSKKSKN